MNQRNSFLLGYLPPVAGVWFNTVALAAEGGFDDCEPVGGYDLALTRLARIDELAAEAGIVALRPRGEDPADYGAWAEAVFAVATDALAAEPPAAVAHLLGYVLGEAVATLDALSVVNRVRAALPPEHLWARLQRDSLERERGTAERRLGRLATHPLLPEAARESAARAAHLVSQRDLAELAELEQTLFEG